MTETMISADTPPQTRFAPAQRRLIQVIGIRRSGNHAIIAWLQTAFASPHHFNNLSHAFFRQASSYEMLAGLDQHDCVICSFENFPAHQAAGKGLLESVGLVDPAAAGSFGKVTVLHVIRDVYNVSASLLRAGMVTSEAYFEEVLADWIALAERCLADETRFVLYNRWFAEPAYRRLLESRLGVVCDDAALGTVSEAGGGSSFDGLPLPPARAMIANYRKYLSAPFLGRLARDPGRYLRRIVKPRIDARALDVENRWRALERMPEARRLFENRRAAELNSLLFGFHVDRDMRRVEREAGAR